jgi:hypothetical protein
MLAFYFSNNLNPPFNYSFLEIYINVGVSKIQLQKIIAPLLYPFARTWVYRNTNTALPK